MSIKRKRISHCRVCGDGKLQTVICLEKMPFTDEFVSKEKIGQEFLADIEIAICNNCGCSQNMHETDMDEYYNDYTYTVQSSGFAIKFMETLARRIKKEFFENIVQPSVIEIGSGSGEQLNEFKKLGFKILGVEPSEKLADYANCSGIPTIKAFFDENISEKLPADFKKVDLIISSYTFDHIPKPKAVLRKIHGTLKDNGIMVHEVHDLDLIRKRNEYCLFEHEHYTYLNERTMSYTLGQNNFKVESFNLLSDAEKRANSLLVAARKANQSGNYSSDPAAELELLSMLNSNIKNSIIRINDWLSKNADKKIAAYGAGGRGIMTIAALKNYQSLQYIVDKNPKAENIYSPKSHIPVHGIEELNRNPVDKILVFSFGYFNEIVEEITGKFNYKSHQFISILELLQSNDA